MPDPPGTQAHQALLRGIVAHYADDQRIRAVTVFGSIGRGTWDVHSDLDLDIIVADDVEIDAIEEAHALCVALEPIAGQLAVLVLSRPDEADAVFSSLQWLSVRYHPLATTNPQIVEDLVVLGGELDREAIVAAGRARRRAPRDPDSVTQECLRYVVSIGKVLQREQLWLALNLLDHLRELLLELFARSRGLPRPAHGFDAHASTELRALLAGLVAAPDLLSTRVAHARAIDLFETDLATWSDGRVALTAAQSELLRRARLA